MTLPHSSRCFMGRKKGCGTKRRCHLGAQQLRGPLEETRPSFSAPLLGLSKRDSSLLHCPDSHVLSPGYHGANRAATPTNLRLKPSSYSPLDGSRSRSSECCPSSSRRALLAASADFWGPWISPWLYHLHIYLFCLLI